ncbi:MAG: 16S rRNA (guanine(527)-N(7))-methyltransferase RsmG [Alphaproteobacteria bacterium]|nr:16S rRNA (guanine(527)-N(7))-methyltransferase RsmG [Alphaproteobacteria bacterium]
MIVAEELQKYDVSRETMQKLQDFVSILTDWNEKMNLVSKNSLSEVWARHVFDSLQLVKYLPEKIEKLVDIGSGAGFPGVVLAVYLAEKSPETKVILVESITKKANYLLSVCSELGLKNVKVINNRIENEKFDGVDVITARAVASLKILCEYAYKTGLNRTNLLFLKGKSYKEELEEAAKFWSFKQDIYQNNYSDDGVILKLADLRKRK